MSVPGSRTMGPEDDADPKPMNGDQTCCAPAVDATDTTSATVEVFLNDDE